MRLIDANALSEKLCETTIFIKDGEVFQRMINDAPTIDAVPVVRCKDCKNRGEICSMRYIEMVGEDERIHDYSTDNGYCHWGERKGGDSE